MRHLNSLEFEIKYWISELVEEHGLMSTNDPRVARLFKNLAVIQDLKQTTYQPRYRLLAGLGRSKACSNLT
jgi:hypothetical protein